MLSKVGVVGKTNHSLRATGASLLFQAGVAEKIVQERTGHRSVKALRLYKRTTTAKHVEVSSILSDCQRAISSKSTPNPATASGTTESELAFTSIFGNTSNCIINVGMCPKKETD